VFCTLLFLPLEAGAYSRDPSDAIAIEPISFVVAQTDFQGGSCQNGYYGALQIRFDGQTVGYGSITDWVQSNGSSDITFSDVTLDAGWILEYASHPTITTDVLSVYAICNASVAIDYGWSANNLSDTFTWSIGEPGPETPTSTDQVYAFPLAVIIFQLAVVVCLLTFKY
jgi:hypothetical protein